MSLLDEALKQIFVGDQRFYEGMDEDLDRLLRTRAIEMLSRVVDIEEIPHLMEDYQEGSNEQSDEDEQDQDENTEQEKKYFINDYFGLDSNNLKSSLTLLQKEPQKRTFLQAIGQRDTNIQLPNSRQYKQANIYRFSDLRYAPTKKVKHIYDKVIQRFLYRDRRSEKRFPQSYYNDLKYQLKLLSEGEIEEHLTKNHMIEEQRTKLKEKQTFDQFNQNLSKYAQLSNESKDNYFVVVKGNEQHQSRLVSQLNQKQYDPQYRNNNLDNADFYEQLYQIGTRKRIFIENQPMLMNNEQNILEEKNEESIDEQEQKQDQDRAKVLDQEFVTQFFGSKVFQNSTTIESKNQLWGEYHQDLTLQSKNKINNLNLCTENLQLDLDLEMPGADIQKRILSQIQHEQELNDKIRENKVDLLDENKKFKESIKKEFEELENQDQNIKPFTYKPYYNEHLVKFCMGEKDHFLEQPFENLKRVEIDLQDDSFFNEKLEVLEHLKRTKIITAQPKFPRPQQKDGASLISRPIEQISLKSFNKIKNSEIPSKQNEKLSIAESEYSQKEEDGFQIEYPSSIQPQQQEQLNMQFLSKEMETYIKEISILIDNHKKKKENQGLIQNSIIAEQFELNDLSESVEKNRIFHRSDIQEILFAEKDRLSINRIDVKQFETWKVNISAKQNQSKLEFKDSENLLLEESAEKLNSHDSYKSIDKLSLVKDEFLLLEYLEQRPLVLNNTGMCIQTNRCVYEQRALETFQKYAQNQRIQKNEEALHLFKQMIVEKLGKYGKIQFLAKSEFLSTQGQLIDDSLMGLALIENDLFRAPIFKQKLPETDFLLVRTRKENSFVYEYVLRQVSYIYLVGQIEPKEEIYTPHSRALGTFLKNCLKTYIKKSFNASGFVNEDTLSEIFCNQSKQNRRNALKECNAVQDQNNQSLWKPAFLNPNGKNILSYDITAKQVCRYESMIYSSHLLYKFGLRKLRNSEKMKKTLQVFLQRHPKDYKTNLGEWVIARRIEDELNMTSWSLSTSFLNSKKQKGRMMLYGFGDPTGGMGGLSYVKRPLKARGEKDSKNPALIEKKPQIFGTDLDLRKLHVKDTKEILQMLGKSPHEIHKLKRWKMINLIGKITQKAQEEQDTEAALHYKQSLEKFSDNMLHQLKIIINYAKSQRLTTKDQKDKYQKELNQMLSFFVQNVTVTVSGTTLNEFRQFKQLVKRKKILEEKLKDLQFDQNEIEQNLITSTMDYMLKLDIFIQKEKNIWENKKKNRGLE